MKNFDKKVFRSTFLAKRVALSKGFIVEASRKIADKILSLEETENSMAFSIYLPIKNEVETNLIIEALTLRGAKIFVPAYSSEIENYIFSKFENWKDLEKGPHRILQPRIVESVDSSLIEVAILPGLAFSKKKVRLGYGKGVFDRLLAKSKALKIGLAYDFQVVDKIPREKHDLIMDVVATEKRVYRMGLK